jgi:hypothetical protein
VQVDTGDLSLSCVALEPLVIADTVYVISRGNVNVVLGAGQDTWHNIGDAGEPTFVAPWANFGAPYVVARYRRENGRVFVEGTIKSGNSGSTAWTMPTAYRPANSFQRQVRGADGSAERLTLVQVGTDGVVSPIMMGAVSAASAISLGFDYPLD